MSTTTSAVTAARPVHRTTAAASPPISAALGTLVRRRLLLSARTPREIVVRLITPVLLAVVAAPVLDSIGPQVAGVDGPTHAVLGTVALLIPINCMFAGIGVIVDRESGARRDLLAAPIPRALTVLANLVVALATTAVQVAVLLVAAVLRGADLGVSPSGVAWFTAAAGLFAVGVYGVAETLAHRTPTLEAYVGAVPALAIVPFFVAGSLVPLSELPAGLTVVAKALPITHALAVMRYGLLGGDASGLHDIWGLDDASAMAVRSLGVVALFAAALTAVALRTFHRAAVQ